MELPDDLSRLVGIVQELDPSHLAEVIDFAAHARERQRQEAHQMLREAMEEVRASIPPELTPEEIEAEIDAAFREVREGRRARGG